MESKDTIFAYNGNEVGSNAHCAEVEQRNKTRKRYVVVLCKGLHKLESYAATTQFLEWEAVVSTFRI